MNTITWTPKFYRIHVRKYNSNEEYDHFIKARDENHAMDIAMDHLLSIGQICNITEIKSSEYYKNIKCEIKS